MKAIYLKFPSEVQGLESLKPYTREFEGVIYAKQPYSVDIIGTIYEPPVVSGEEIISPAVALDGWHVNMLVPDDFDVFAEYEVVPVSPRRVFGGWKPKDNNEVAAVGAAINNALVF